tara:strand:- start:847 stop:1248 length:402 start_codon:yes stop_codon:yes gene_type:complete
MTPTLMAVSWVAISFLSISYWFQIYKIHVHKEVRDLSIPYHILLALGFGILIWTAWEENSTIFIVKQIATFIPVCILIAQILYHRRDHWHDDGDVNCSSCRNELEYGWCWCPYCGKKNPSCTEVNEDNNKQKT